MKQPPFHLSYGSKRYISELDGLRGVAILSVILFHCFPSTLTRGGWMGVDLFFVLSGFLITGILVDSKGHERFYINFIGRRILRIFPLYYVVLVVILFLAPLIQPSILSQHFSYYSKNQLWFWTYMQNWLYAKDGFPKDHLLIHFWTLGVECQFYLIWPWIIKYCPRHKLIKLCLCLCAVSISFRLLPIHTGITFRYMSTVSRMDALLIGSMTAILIRDKVKLLERITIPVCVGSMIIVLMGLAIKRSINFIALPQFYTAIDLFLASILILCLSSIKWINKIINQKFLIQLGKYSYGLYVYHYIIFVLLDYNIASFLNIHVKNSLLRMLILGFVSVAMATAISILSYNYFESRFLKLKKYLPYSKNSIKQSPVIILEKQS